MDNLPEVYNFNAFGTHTDVFLLKAGERIKQHRHDYPHSIFIGNGSVKVFIGTMETILNKGDQLMAPYGILHEIEAITDAVVINTAPNGSETS